MTQLRENPRTKLTEQVAAIKEELPKNIRELIYKKFPEYNTAKGANLINNVLAGRTADARLTEILKAFHFEYKVTQPSKTLTDSHETV